MATVAEALNAKSISDWTLTGPNAIVKVVSPEDAAGMTRFRRAKGYVTQAKFLEGHNANQIERDLGLRPNSMNSGLYIFWFARLPTCTEVEYRFAADWPDGRPWSEEKMAEFFRERDKLLTAPGRLPIIQSYPPGSGRIAQWKLTACVPLSGLFRQATPSVPFQV